MKTCLNYLCVLAILLLPFSLLSAAPLELNGAITQGGLITGTTLPGARVLHDGEPVRVSNTGVFVIGFHRDAAPESSLEVILPDGEQIVQNLKVAQRDYNIQRIDGLPPSKVTPMKPEVLERIREETALVKQARKHDDTRLDFLDGFDWPVTGRISGVYGSQRVLNGKPRRPHYGVDIATPAGTPVRAPADGVVTLAHPDMYYSGGTLILDHGHGVSSAFLHLKRVLVEEGQTVQRGDVIAEVGSTGRSTGPHLDWRINLFDKRLDPQLFARPMPQSPKTAQSVDE